MFLKTLVGREGQTATTGLTIIRKPLPVNPVHAFAQDCTVHAYTSSHHQHVLISSLFHKILFTIFV